MDEETKKKAEAAAKLGFGAARVVSGAVLGTGHGLLGSYMKNHNAMPAARFYAKRSIEAGVKMFKEGLADWKKAKS